MFSDGIKIVVFYEFDTTVIPSNAKTNYYILTVKPEAVSNPTYVTAYVVPNTVSNYDSYSQSKGNPVESVYMSTIGQSYTFNIPASDISQGNNTIVLESSSNGVDFPEQALVLNSDAQLATVYSGGNTAIPEFPTIAVTGIFLAISLFSAVILTIRKLKIDKR